MSTITSDSTASTSPNGVLAPNGAAANATHFKQKRARSQLSCTACRSGKLKCNREKPACDQCMKRNKEAQCVYVPPPVKSKTPQNVKGRIRQLEDLVVGLMATQQSGAKQTGGQQRTTSDSDSARQEYAQARGPLDQLTPPSDSDISPQQYGDGERGQQGHVSTQSDERTTQDDGVDAATTPFGQMRISKNEISYVGSNHWNAILNSISELKQDLGDDRESNDDQDEDSSTQQQPGFDTNPTAHIQSSEKSPPMVSYSDAANWGRRTSTNSGLGFIFESAGAVTKQQLIASVPEKRTADRLLSLWFNSPDPFKPIIHAPTFQEEYKNFWKNPQGTPTMWLSLLYSILSLAASFALRDSDPNSQRTRQVVADVNKYHSLAASAAVLADFTKPKLHTIEALILYTAGLRSDDAFMNVWLSIGLIIRLALRMGYHRDASHYPNISPFIGEMRRRTWAIISMIDVLVSFQLGLPSMVKTIQSDAEPPRNLLDRDFSLAYKTLPQSRGVDELTPSSYTRAKLRIVRVFADAAEFSHATVPPAHEEMMKLDQQLEEAKAAIPPLLQMPEERDGEIVTDPAEQLMCRFNLDLLYLKTKTVLHRRYMLTPFEKLSTPEQAFGVGTSRRLCTECALRVLKHHQSIYQASQTGGQLESVKWYMGSISTHDFLLAAMIICLELSLQIQDPFFGRPPQDLVACPRRAAMMEALERSQRIWSEAARLPQSGLGYTNDIMAMADKHGQNNTTKRRVFDDTEKAAKAMAVMLDKVRAQFGVRGVREGERIMSGCSSATGVSQAVRDHEFARASQRMQGWDQGQGEQSSSLAFASSVMNEMSAKDGKIDHAQQANAFGLPAAFSTGSSTFNPFSTHQSFETQQQQSVTAPDFSALGSMLDFSAPIQELDWEMWDNEISRGQPATGQGSNEWSPNQLSGVDFNAPDNAFGSPEHGSYNIPGNILLGGSAPLSAGANAYENGFSDFELGTGTRVDELISSGMNGGGDGHSSLLANDVPVSLAMGDPAVDLDNSMTGSLADVRFDLGVSDYNKNGAYPLTSEEWASFGQRRGNGDSEMT